jgi:hypothetical protein
MDDGRPSTHLRYAELYNEPGDTTGCPITYLLSISLSANSLLVVTGVDALNQTQSEVLNLASNGHEE